MKYIPYYSLILLFLTISNGYTVVPDESSSEWRYSLNGEWKFAYRAEIDELLDQSFYTEELDETEWRTISVPSYWELSGFADPIFGRYGKGTGYYRYRFMVPRLWEGRQIYLQWNGVLPSMEVWLDGRFAGNWDHGSSPAQCNITEFLKVGETHLLAVKVNAGTAWKNRPFETWALSGIYREVFLFSVPSLCLNSLIVDTEINPEGKSGLLKLKFDLQSFEKKAGFDEVTVNVKISDAERNEVGQIEITYFKIEENHASAEISLPIQNPKLWTAEFPYLYTLNIELRRNGLRLQSIERQIGFRQISIQRDVLLWNREPIRCRGICYTGLDPSAGLALYDEAWMRDLELMKRANINTIRVIEWLPHPRFLELCDQMGMYVICKAPQSLSNLPAHTPYGFPGIQEPYLNHPSILAWIVEEENGAAGEIREQIKRIQNADPSRPVLWLGNSEKHVPEEADMLSTSFPSVDELKRLGRENKPVLVAEHTHALDTAFEGLQEFWEEVLGNRELAGGMIWRFADQGIHRAIAPEQAINSRQNPFTLDLYSSTPSKDDIIDGETILDCHGMYGLDGIVDADRTPQTDYWQTRRVYSPIHIEETERNVKLGKNVIELTLRNEYDFTNLRETSCQWFLQKNKTAVDSGTILFDLEPGKTMEMAVTVDIPEDITDSEYALRIHFTDRWGYAVYEHAVRLKPDRWEESFVMRLRDLEKDENWAIQADNEEVRVDHRDYVFRMNTWNNSWFLMTREHHVRLITGGPFIRIGRNPTLAERIQERERDNFSIPPSPMIRNLVVKDRNIDKKNKDVEIQTLYFPAQEFPSVSPMDALDEILQARIDLLISPYGFCDVGYEFFPSDREEQYLELGLSFLVPPTFHQISWLGTGPYPTYPGKEALSIFGVFQYLLQTDQFFTGTRYPVDLVALTDDRGYGLGLMMIHGKIGIEPTEEGILVSVLSAVAGQGTKNRQTAYSLVSDLLPKSKRVAIFRMIPLIRGRYPKLFDDVFFAK